MEQNNYIASDGKVYDITTLNTERLINSHAKHSRDIYASETKEQFIAHSEQIAIIETELLRRNQEFYDKKVFSGIWK